MLCEVVSHGTFVSTMRSVEAALVEAGLPVIEPALRRLEGDSDERVAWSWLPLRLLARGAATAFFPSDLLG